MDGKKISEILSDLINENCHYTFKQAMDDISKNVAEARRGEREACAKVAENETERYLMPQHIATNIRERGNDVK